MDQGADQGQFLSHPARQFPCLAVQERRKPGHSHQTVPVFPELRFRKLAQITEKSDIFFDGQAVVKVETNALGHVADKTLDLFRLLQDINASHHGQAIFGIQHACQYLKDTGLAGPVRTYEPKDLSFGYLKGDALYCLYAFTPVAFTQGSNADNDIVSLR